MESSHKQKHKGLRLLGTSCGAFCIAFVIAWLLIGEQNNTVSAAQSNFMGGSPYIEDSDAINTLRLVFPAGVRSNWHSHSWGQLLMLEEGKALTQDRGGDLIEVLPHQPWFTQAGVEHWHGASPDVDALQLTIYQGDVNWLEPVSDEQYLATPVR